ncbi:HD domain-containing protein 2-like [Trifolium pratense]|uniref:5'-deoxynucleotidase n=1 Tax=Trifolium pratense TaxID=57577 RepID=A0A2K3NX83_TRIPR|nr:HD domain-containing protein 2-like [Trifolium pratense]
MATAPSSSSPSPAVTGDTNTTPPPSSPPVPNASPSPYSTIDFLTVCHHLKMSFLTKMMKVIKESNKNYKEWDEFDVLTTKRSGWVRRDVKNPESIADHMYRMSLMALIAPDVPGLDRNKCIKMTIVHDIAEALIGDITPLDGISKAEKSEREQAAVDYMCKIIGVGEGSRGNEITELWMEYEANSSPEAKFVKDLDKVEMILQALEYEDEQEKDLDEFFQSTAGKFQTEIGKAWASEIVSRRNNT